MKKKKRILYVDDDEEIIFVQKSILERFGYEVSIYSNPLAALEQFQAASEKYDIAIIDLLMPSLNGDVLAYEMKKLKPAFPIILCTGYDAGMAETIVRELGVEGFLIKPIAYKVMLKTLECVLKAAF